MKELTMFLLEQRKIARSIEIQRKFNQVNIKYDYTNLYIHYDDDLNIKLIDKCNPAYTSSFNSLKEYLDHRNPFYQV